MNEFDLKEKLSRHPPEQLDDLFYRRLKNETSYGESKSIWLKMALPLFSGSLMVIFIFNILMINEASFQGIKGEELSVLLNNYEVLEDLENIEVSELSDEEWKILLKEDS